MIRILRFLFFGVFVRFFVLCILGIHVRRPHLLPKQGPAILVANHNSHLDTLVLMSLYPLRILPHLRPVAAADYFFRNRTLKWFALHIIGILPIERNKAARSTLQGIEEALQHNAILIFFPEGSRGEPEQFTQMKGGIATIAAKWPDVPVTPIFMHGLGQALPRGDWLPVPFFCDVFVGEPLYGEVYEREVFVKKLTERMTMLSQEKQFAPWE